MIRMANTFANNFNIKVDLIIINYMDKAHKSDQTIVFMETTEII